MKHPGGRPTSYNPEYCQEAIDYLSQGKSITQLARKLGVNKSSIYEWAKVHEEFSNALNMGRQNSQAYWEDELVDMMRDRNVNAPLVKLYFANRFNWHDKQETKQETSSTYTVVIEAPEDD